MCCRGYDTAGGRIASVSESGHPLPFTATAADSVDGFVFGANSVLAAMSGLRRDRLTGVGRGWSLRFTGYFAAAIEAASQGVREERTLAIISSQGL